MRIRLLNSCSFFRRIIIIAKNNGWIFADPFANYTIRLKRVDRGYLTEKEVEKIIKKKFATDRLNNVRDIFIFSCFTGYSSCDFPSYLSFPHGLLEMKRGYSSCPVIFYIQKVNAQS